MATFDAMLCGTEDDIQLAQYGSSNSAKMKTLYREGLKRRYGSLMQIISVCTSTSSPNRSGMRCMVSKMKKLAKKRNPAYFA